MRSSVRALPLPYCLYWLLAVGLAAAMPGAHAASCEAALRPDAAQIRSDYAVARAYMALEADSEYERLTRLDEQARMADASYVLFSTELEGSRTAEEFRQRLRARLRDESYVPNVPELRGLARVHVSDGQIADWSICASESAAGSLLLVASEPNAKSFPLKVAFVPPAGVEGAQFVLSLDGGLINGQHTVSDTYAGMVARSYTVKPDAGSRRLIIDANIAGVSDGLIVDVTPRAPIVSITACDELVAAGPSGEGVSGGLAPQPVADATKPGKAWAYGCKATRRVVAQRAAANAPADAVTTVSVCDGPAGMTYRRTAGHGIVLAPESRPGAAVMQGCRSIAELKVQTGPAACTNRVPALVCSGHPRRLVAAGDIIVPGAAKNSSAPYALLCERAQTQPVCAVGE